MLILHLLFLNEISIRSIKSLQIYMFTIFF